MGAGKLERNRAPIEGFRCKANRPSCDGHHIALAAAPLLSGHVGPEEECDMIADWIVIYAVLFVLCAAVVSGVPSKG